MVNIIIFLNFVSLILKYTNFKFRGGGGDINYFICLDFFQKKHTLFMRIYYK